MKLTTKIILGIISSIFLISLIFIIGFSFSNRKNWTYSYYKKENTISQENPVEIELDVFNTILIDGNDDNPDENIIIAGTLSVRPDINNKNKLVLSEEMNQYVSLNYYNDTLNICFDKSKLLEKRTVYPERNIYLHIRGADLQLFTNNTNLISNYEGFNIDIKGIKSDYIKMNTSYAVNIDSCEILSLNPYMCALQIANSTINKLNIDLDSIRDWNTDNCFIEVQNVTGSEGKEVFLKDNKTKELNWYPKNEHAHLKLTLQSDTAKIILQ